MDLTPRTIQRWREQGDQGFDRRFGPKTPPRNKLSTAERKKVLEAANRPEYRDLSPKQIVPRLADEGIYIASESTFYRTLHAEDALHHREPSRPRNVARPREYVATGPSELWSWDITYLRSAVRGAWNENRLARFTCKDLERVCGVPERATARVSRGLVKKGLVKVWKHGRGLVFFVPDKGPLTPPRDTESRTPRDTESRTPHDTEPLSTSEIQEPFQRGADPSSDGGLAPGEGTAASRVDEGEDLSEEDQETLARAVVHFREVHEPQAIGTVYMRLHNLPLDPPFTSTILDRAAATVRAERGWAVA